MPKFNIVVSNEEGTVVFNEQVDIEHDDSGVTMREARAAVVEAADMIRDGVL